MTEKHKPLPSEIKRAENSMSNEQCWLTRDREKAFKEKQELLDKYEYTFLDSIKTTNG